MSCAGCFAGTGASCGAAPVPLGGSVSTLLAIEAGATGSFPDDWVRENSRPIMPAATKIPNMKNSLSITEELSQRVFNRETAENSKL
jgi:hypothetical protein